MIKKLLKLKRLKNLVSICRDNIDDNSIHGFILEFSNELLIIQYIYDFNIDGIMVLRIKDITSIESSNTDLFQTQLLKDEKLYSQIDFQISYGIGGWKSVFKEFSKLYKFVIVEDQDYENPLFVLGKVNKIGKNKISILEFSGTAKWKKNVTKVCYKQIASFQVGNNYSEMYLRYFDRNSKDA